jgi:hypothetical protein
LSRQHHLGRVTGAVDVPRGPDVLHRLRVAAAWLEEGALIEFELPRNLKCAACEGGGCDRCERSGAISVRGRKEIGEVVQVTLPKRTESSYESTASGRTIVIRIPERGGIAPDPDLPRGLLLLSVVPADEPDPGVARVERPVAAAPVAGAEPVQELPPARPARSAALWVLAVLVILWVLFLIWLRMSGRA